MFNEPVMQEANTNNDTSAVVDISTTGFMATSNMNCLVYVVGH